MASVRKAVRVNGEVHVEVLIAPEVLDGEGNVVTPETVETHVWGAIPTIDGTPVMTQAQYATMIRAQLVERYGAAPARTETRVATLEGSL